MTAPNSQDKRRATYLKVKDAIVDLMQELEREPSSQIERDVMIEDSCSFILSTDNLHKMQALQKEVSF